MGTQVLLSWAAETSNQSGTLFEVFAALARGEVQSLPALRPHQREPFHAFAVQVAALALIRAGAPVMPTDAAAWHIAARTHPRLAGGRGLAPRQRRVGGARAAPAADRPRRRLR